MQFVKESRIAAPPSEVFAFHESPGALRRLTPPWERVELESGGESIRPGSRVVLRTWLGPIPLRWVAEHTEYDPPRLFADRQVSGPFARGTTVTSSSTTAGGDPPPRRGRVRAAPGGPRPALRRRASSGRKLAQDVRLPPRGDPPDRRVGRFPGSLIPAQSSLTK